MNLINFVKMHGAENDFILIDDRDGRFPINDHIRLALMASPRIGIACEGVILVQNSDKADFKMVFFNPDGTEADLCGNGSRCVAAFAYGCGIVKSRCMTIETRAGLLDAEVIDDNQVKVWMPSAKDRHYNMTVQGRTGDWVTVGVPHFITSCDRLGEVDVDREGRALRLDAAFAPNGTNVDFVQFHAPSKVSIRTYERGVEAESGACGTGAVAAAVVAVETKKLSMPVHVRTRGGYDLVIDGDWQDGKTTRLTLTGPVKRVFEGVIDMDSIDTSNEME